MVWDHLSITARVLGLCVDALIVTLLVLVIGCAAIVLFLLVTPMSIWCRWTRTWWAIHCYAMIVHPLAWYRPRY